MTCDCSREVSIPLCISNGTNRLPNIRQDKQHYTHELNQLERFFISKFARYFESQGATIRTVRVVRVEFRHTLFLASLLQCFNDVFTIPDSAGGLRIVK